METNKIFISHSKKDREIALKLIKKLKEYEFEVWYDEFEIKIGDNFLEKIYSGINECKYLIIIITNNSINSRFVNEELSYAKLNELKLQGIKILPLLFENCTIPDSIKLLQYGNFIDFEHGINQLLYFFGKVDIRDSILQKTHDHDSKRRPKIIIGLGSTGVITAAKIKSKLNATTLNDLYRFITFDTWADIECMKNFKDTEFIAGIIYLNTVEIKEKIATIDGEVEHYKFITSGSGGDRSIGRIAFRNHINEFTNLFNAAFFELSKIKIQPSIHLIASLTGGTGSGALFECSELIRKICFPADVELYGHLGILIDNPYLDIENKNYNESLSEIKRDTKIKFQNNIFSPLLNDNKFYSGADVNSITENIVDSILHHY